MRFHLWLMTALEQADSQRPLKMEISNTKFKLKLADYVMRFIGRPIPYFSNKNLLENPLRGFSLLLRRARRNFYHPFIMPDNFC